MHEPVAISSRIEDEKLKGQSVLHRELTHRARGWLANRATGRGVRGSFEVWLADKYVADSVLLLSFQQRFYSDCLQLRLIYSTDRLSRTEIDQKLLEQPTNDFVIVIESKASRADFKSTFSRWDESNPRYLSRGNLHFLVTPKKLVSPDEVPMEWGLLEASGRGLRLVRWPEYQALADDQYFRVASQILWSGLVYDHSLHEFCPDCNQELKQVMIQIMESPDDT